MVAMVKLIQPVLKNIFYLRHNPAGQSPPKESLRPKAATKIKKYTPQRDIISAAFLTLNSMSFQTDIPIFY